MTESQASTWYWCLDHERAERHGEACPADRRLGPYGSADEAASWRQKADARNQKWDDDDRRWEGDA